LGDCPVLKKELRENLLRPECVRELQMYLQTDVFNQIIGIIMMTIKIFKKKKKKNDAVAL
jgi:hypothetical protein